MNSEPRARLLTALLLAGAALLLLVRIGATDLWAPDEPRFAQVADEMRALERGPVDLVVLRLNGQVYTQKPPLYYWIVAALGSTQGHVEEWMARLPSALAGIALVLVCVHLGHALTGRRSIGLWGGAILLTVFRFGHLARRAQLDIPLALFFSLAMLAIWRLAGPPWARDDRRTPWIVLLHGSLGLAMLTKGPVGLLPLLVGVVLLAWERRLPVLRGLAPIWSFALSLGPTLLWVGAAVALAPVGYFQEAVVDNVFHRFASGTAHIRPVHYFLTQFPLDFLPWTLLWPLVALQAWRDRSRGDAQRDDDPIPAARRFLLAWVATLLVLFSISAGKRGLYMAPAYPAAALLCGMALDRSLEARDRLPAWLAGALAIAALTSAGAGAGVWWHGGLELDRYPGFELPASFGVLLMSLAAGALVAHWGSIVCGAGISARVAIVVVTIGALEGLVFAVAYPAFDPEKSPRPISRAAASVTPEGRPIAVFDHPEFVGGVAYYARRPIVNAATPEDVRAYFAAGGTALIVKARRLGRLSDVGPLEILARTRSGGRELLVVGAPPESGVLPSAQVAPE